MGLSWRHWDLRWCSATRKRLPRRYAATRSDARGRAISDLQRLSAHGYADLPSDGRQETVSDLGPCDDVQLGCSPAFTNLFIALTANKRTTIADCRRPRSASARGHPFLPAEESPSHSMRATLTCKAILDPTARRRKTTSCTCSTIDAYSPRSRRSVALGTAAAPRSRGRPSRWARGAHDFCHALRGYGAEVLAGDLARAAAFGTEEGDPNYCGAKPRRRSLHPAAFRRSGSMTAITSPICAKRRTLARSPNF